MTDTQVVPDTQMEDTWRDVESVIPMETRV